jgi:hypothetical protein
MSKHWVLLAALLTAACTRSVLEVRPDGAADSDSDEVDAGPAPAKDMAVKSALDTRPAPEPDAETSLRPDGPNENPTCGTLGKPCCAGNLCAQGGSMCIKNFCARCGMAAGDPCCPPPAGSRVGAPATCSGPVMCNPDTNTCRACGRAGDECCDDGTCTGGACCYSGTCLAERQVCGSTGTCQAGRCSGCGGPGQPCCGSTCVGAGVICQDGTCAVCGGVGQMCCPEDGTKSRCGSGASCSTATGVCQKCGGTGEPCCAGSTCAGGGCCLGGTCTAATAKCTSGGKDYGTCQAGKCSACGAAGQTCCPAEPGGGVGGWRCSDPAANCGEPSGPTGARICQPCGTLGGKCCSDKACHDNGTACLAMPPNGFLCRKCGSGGEPCCRQPGVIEPFCNTGYTPSGDAASAGCTCS